MTAEETLTNRQGRPDAGDDRLVSIDVASGVATAVPAEPGIKIGPAFLPSGDIAYIRKNIDSAGIYYGNGKAGPKGDVRSASWSPDGARVVFHKRLTAPPVTWRKTFSRHPAYELTLTGILPSFSPSGDRFTFVGRPTVGARNLGSSIAVATTGEDKSNVIFHQAETNVLGPQWSPRGDRIIFGIGRFQAFYNGFHSLFLNPPDRVDGGAQIAIINPDGTDYREVTTGPNNNGFPSMAPDGKRFVYRSFGPEGDGLRIMNMETKVSTVLTKGYDNFPLWSPRGDLIMFTRQDEGDYEIYSIKPDGTGVRRLTFARGNDTHQAWSPDGERIAFASSRLGYKDEALLTDGPQPYGEIFVMRSDGTGLEQLTDNQWEDGTPAFQPPARLSSRR
jgi:Tol biopolymer transport system component